MSIGNFDVHWVCSYTHAGSECSVVIISDDPDALNEQMSAVLPEFEITGWWGGFVQNASDLDVAIADAETLQEPEAYRNWVLQNKSAFN